ncbi:MAG: MBL fold metallo-hydrolase [Planctomycetota bacterium]
MGVHYVGCEIDFIAVGDGERSGDAIAVRWGNLSGSPAEQSVIVIDGGNVSSGEDLVNRVRSDYGSHHIDAVISTHPDADHAKGLATVMNQFSVGALWLHQPWNRANDIHDLVLDGRVTPASLESRIKTALSAAYDLERIAEDRNIDIWEPFAGLPIEHNGATFHVLGPSEEYYSELLPQFDDVPVTKLAMATEAKSLMVANAADNILAAYQSWSEETLVEPTEKIRAENNSSVILLMQYEGRQVLFTADAGVEALTFAYQRALALGIDLKDCTFIQIPHHGSRRNVGPEILDSIVGNVLPYGSTPTKTAYVSCAANSPKHPSAKVLNAFTRRGAAAYATRGSSIRYSWNAPARLNWSPLAPIPIQSEAAEG